MPILYTLIARGEVVLTEYTATKGNFPTLSRTLLKKITDSDTKMSCVYEQYAFHYVVHDGITYLCMADKDMKRRIPFAYLDDIQEIFIANYGALVKTASAGAMNTDFSKILKERMEYFNTDKNSDAITNVQGQIQGVKTVMVNNISKIVDRGGLLENLIEKSDQLENQTYTFQKECKDVKNKMCCQHFRIVILIVILVVLLLVGLTIYACGGFLLPNCLPSQPSNTTALFDTYF
ncbi:hypothetical protein WA158_004198 [Blastocystis sp. Blastoise]